MKAPKLAIALAAPLCVATPLAAQTAEAPAADTIQIHRLTPAQIEAARASAQEHSADGVLDPGVPGDRAIHGEIGAMIGTGGSRGLYGTAAIPLGDNGGAVISFDNERWGRR